MNRGKNKWMLFVLLIWSIVYGSCGTGITKSNNTKKEEVNDSVSIIPVSLANDTSFPTKKTPDNPMVEEVEKQRVRDTLPKRKMIQIGLQKQEITAHPPEIKYPQQINRVKDTLNGFAYDRWIIFYDQKEEKILKCIDLVLDNPYVKEGLEIDSVNWNGTHIYFRLPEGTNKTTIKKYLPVHEYDSIPSQWIDEKALSRSNAYSMSDFNSKNNFVVGVFSFEWIGLEREWIRGDYVTNTIIVWDSIGTETYRMNSEGFNFSAFTSTNGKYLISFREEFPSDEHKSRQCVNIIHTPTNKIIHKECQKEGEYYLFSWPSDKYLSFGYKNEVIKISIFDIHNQVLYVESKSTNDNLFRFNLEIENDYITLKQRNKLVSKFFFKEDFQIQKLNSDENK